MLLALHKGYLKPTLCQFLSLLLHRLLLSISHQLQFPFILFSLLLSSPLKFSELDIHSLWLCNLWPLEATQILISTRTNHLVLQPILFLSYFPLAG